MSNLQQWFKRIDNILLEDAGTNGPNDYMTQISWLLFLKYLDDLEDTRQHEAQLTDKKYQPLFKEEFMWRNWAHPKDDHGKADLSRQLVGRDLVEFVNQKLFPYLKKFKETSEDPRSLLYKIGEIFGELNNKVQNGNNLREAIDIIDEMEFKTQEELDDLSHLYEDRLKLLGGAGRSGEFYTPRPLIKTMIKAIDPKLGKTIYDGAAGTAGFLTESYVYLRQKELTSKQLKFLKEDTFYGKNKKPEPYLLGTMNMILHGIESPNMLHANTLTENLADIQEKDRYDYVLANPPFGGSERTEIKRNFPVESSETANLFLQHFMKMLRAGGSAAVVIKNTFLSNVDAASVSIRKELLQNYNLYAVFDLPSGVFGANSSTGVKTVVLFFDKGSSTQNIWYYQLNVGRNMGKTNPLNENDLSDFLKNYATRADSANSWSINITDVDKITFDLSVKNPNAPEEAALRTPEEILKEIQQLDKEAEEILTKV